MTYIILRNDAKTYLSKKKDTYGQQTMGKLNSPLTRFKRSKPFMTGMCTSANTISYDLSLSSLCSSMLSAGKA